MSIAIVTALFPPERSATSLYAKQLAERVAGVTHLLTYQDHPESVEGVAMVTVNKRTNVLSRILAMTKSIFVHTNNIDVIIVLNGPSVDLPIVFFSFFSRKKIVYVESDHRVLTALKESWSRRLLTTVMKKRADHTLQCASEVSSSLQKPEFHPLVTHEYAVAQKVHETAWQEHLAQLNKLL